IAATFCIHDATTAYYLLGGYDHASKHRGAGAAALWAAIGHAKGIGLKRFDFEGSMVPQIERYFRGFGGTQTLYLTINKAALPLEMLLKITRRQTF
ncbi:MAG: GNAT family N-acetyltransferase, partial [Candidatus Edwardsbacteria bacterium]|nr:GNAT family N-acetyltransferase [Candidatus Edwardsbacteria bacterium]